MKGDIDLRGRKMNPGQNLNKYTIVIDFDGTVTREDTGLAVITRFGAPGWEAGIEKYRSGEFNSMELHHWEVGFLPSLRAREMTEFAADSAEIRPGFRELVEYAADHEIPVEIASSGWSFYVEAVLGRHGFGEIPFTSAAADFDGGEFASHALSPGATHCEINGVCKCDRVRPRQDAGTKVIYVGDGLSDFCVAAQSDVVFARRSLAEHCGSAGIAFTPFEDFFEVLAGIRLLIEAEA